ncbi:hypothetical protein LuPra_02452 [Luteitalea pratensis]|uniref:Uncharacterized protein n=1 Tax=Luteitalea pratensis TaxID=1855912 RepID=A0A143PNA0_LUTPR|nr:hypothetical protein [Luteitalea pratensis]AMY09239.1 hypothetical protein LuPra_02452 [Luteitalea pratensis]
MHSRIEVAAAFALILVMLAVPTAFAQPAGAPSGQPGLAGAGVPVRSPEVTPDGTTTFRLSAPQATSVLVRNTSGGFADLAWRQRGRDDQG